ncbi:MAG: hypothetical protein MUP64_12180 [Anaerolineae bacterium]|nr:hypothetical protein [Anaerolineae bacterium]
MKKGRAWMPVMIGATLVVVALAWWGVASASSGAPTVVIFQGRLTDEHRQPVNDTVSMVFALYATSEGGTPAWSETHDSIAVTDGLFRAYLGESVPLSAEVLSENPYLGLTVGSDSEMSPRQRLGSVPYARTLAPGAVISATASGPLVTVRNGLDAEQEGDGTALLVHNTCGLGPALMVRLDSAADQSAAFGSAIYARRESGIGSWATIQSTNYSVWPGLAANSTGGTALVGIAGDPGTIGNPAGGPIRAPLSNVLTEQKAGVLGQSSIGPGVFAWSTITHSLVVSGTALVTGDILVGGGVITNADVAERYVAVGTLEPGDVVVLDTSTPLGVRRADQPCDTLVAGVISTDPAIILPGPVEGIPLALIGRAPVKADAGYGAITVGDLLTTSPTPGHAMRCPDRLECIGAIIGKALEPLKEGRGVILVLVTHQ